MEIYKSDLFLSASGVWLWLMSQYRHSGRYIQGCNAQYTDMYVSTFYCSLLDTCNETAVSQQGNVTIRDWSPTNLVSSESWYMFKNSTHAREKIFYTCLVFVFNMLRDHLLNKTRTWMLLGFADIELRQNEFVMEHAVPPSTPWSKKSHILFDSLLRKPPMSGFFSVFILTCPIPTKQPFETMENFSKCGSFRKDTLILWSRLHVIEWLRQLVARASVSGTATGPHVVLEWTWLWLIPKDYAPDSAEWSESGISAGTRPDV